MREGGFRTWMSTLETCEGVSWVTKFVFLLNKVINKNHTVRGEIRTWISILETLNKVINKNHTVRGEIRTWISILETCKGISWVTKLVFLHNKIINKNHVAREGGFKLGCLH